MLDKTQSSTSPDTKTYLREIIEHYDLILEQKKIPEELNSFIQEEKYKCLHHLRKIRELDLMIMLSGNVSV
tara:strand:- start:660 stop:872 length:213 start_codon:yes stop_codon:yes gene_type:complete